MVMRIALLMAIGWLLTLGASLFHLSDFAPTAGLVQWLHANEETNEVSGRDLILLAGGLFLLWTSVREIHEKVEGHDEKRATPLKQVTMSGVLMRVVMMDVIFSLDSVITAVGMAKQIEIMIAAVVVAVGVMIVFANQISDFVQQHPTVKMLALSFLLLIGVVLISESNRLADS